MSKRGGKKQKKVVEGYYKREIDSIAPQKASKTEISSEEEEQEQNFEHLAKLPISAESHLILKSDQERFQAESVISFSKYFNVDVGLLNAAIKTIPFNEIHDIKGANWSEEELNYMKYLARVNEDFYKQMLVKNAESDSKAPETKHPAEETTLEKNVSELTISSSSSPVKSKQPVEEGQANGSKASMEKWLDDILDV